MVRSSGALTATSALAPRVSLCLVWHLPSVVVGRIIRIAQSPTPLRLNHVREVSAPAPGDGSHQRFLPWEQSNNKA